MKNDESVKGTGVSSSFIPPSSSGRLLIVDGHAYAYRAFYAIRSLRSPSGQAVNGIFGFVKMLAKLRATVGPSHVLVVWDGGLSAERLAAWPAYKAQRPEMPPELGAQLAEMLKYLAAAGVASFCRDGVEADDYIACVARRAERAGFGVVVASSDKDFMQLVTVDGATGHGGWIGLLNPNDKSEQVWAAEQVRNKAGVEPSQIVDWLSLVGDAVDNIPGVPGVGPKTASELLGRFGSVAGIYGRLSEVKSERIRAALGAAEGAVRRNVGLVRLQDDLACEFSPEALAVGPADAGQLAELFRGWGFRSLLAELAASQSEQPDLI
jgi:DNA polymerase I